MLMAAGLGTRLRPFTDILPKPLLPLLGVPMAQYALDAMAHAGVARVVANVHLQGRVVGDALRALDRGSMELSISDESALLLGSGGGIRQALPLLGEGPFFLMNADTLSDVNLGALLARHRELKKSHGVLVTLAVFEEAPGTGKYREILWDKTGTITGLGEVASRRPFFVGVAVVEPEAVSHLEAGKPNEFVPTILNPAIAAGRAGAYVTSGRWHDVGSPRLWLETHLELLQGIEDAGFPELWKTRIQSINRRVSAGIWADLKTRLDGVGLSAPAYLGQDAKAVSALGPRGVLYGRAVETPCKHGIGYGGRWSEVPVSVES